MGPRTRPIRLLAALSACLVLAAGSTRPALASSMTATEAVSAGTLGFNSAPGGIALATVLSGYDQTATSAYSLDVADLSGSGAGWNITATSTTFTTGSQTLATTATTVSANPGSVCDTAGQCSAYAATGTVTYPYTMPAAAVAPAATKLVANAANNGMGGQTLNFTFGMGVNGGAYAGNYISTWTFSLVSGP